MAAGRARPVVGVILAALLPACASSGAGTATQAEQAGTRHTSTTAPTATTVNRVWEPKSVPAEPEPDPPEPTPAEPAAWIVGAEPLPLRPDGYGEIAPTPDALLDRRLPTVSSLPAPATDAFEWSVRPLDAEILGRMGATWAPGCPVGPDDLRHVTVSFWGFDGRHHTGELVLHRDVVDEVVWVFARIHGERFPLEEMRLIISADLDAAPTGDGNNTAAFICRPVRGGASWSAHALGKAVDINPFHNPYQRGDVVLPERASTYLDRTWRRPGMVVAGDVVTDSFARIGWTWGGNWSNADHMHFSATGG
jgi:hypothetical protein